MGKKLIPEVVIPEHWEYECDFFHGDDEEALPLDRLYAIKVKHGGGKSYGMLVSVMSENATFIICDKCLSNFGALDVQARKSVAPLRSGDTSKTDKTGTE